MSTNYFKCRKCQKITRHIEIDLEEYNALDDALAGKDPSFFSRMGSKFFEYTGVDDGIRFLRGTKYWKCCECGYPSEKNAAGKDIW